jgi:hypothetical protein
MTPDSRAGIDIGQAGTSLLGLAWHLSAVEEHSLQRVVPGGNRFNDARGLGVIRTEPSTVERTAR